MTDVTLDLPSGWETARRSDEDSITGTYQHEHLDVEISISKMDPDDFGIDVDAEYIYDYFLQWGGEIGGVEAPFDPPGEVTSAAEATDWAIALMNQVTQQFEPGDADYVSRAIDATKGERVSSGSGSSAGTHRDVPTCPVCDAPFFQFRGFDTYEQAQHHLEYMGDEEHEDWDVSLTEVE